jgi:8-oxo-dGTP pyrophosphatase MutT (NUDIX family)
VRWTVGASRTLYDCPWFRVDLTEVTLPDGRQLTHHVIRAPSPVVAVLAVDDQERVLLLYRHRFITDRWGWELPAGAAEPGEDPTAAAARELAEETGMHCSSLQPLGRADLSNGLTDQHVLLYRGRGISDSGTIASPEESSERRWFTPTEQSQILAVGGVHDALTQLALLHHARAQAWA